MQPTLTIDMVSDFACPWCYIGERRLHQAVLTSKLTEIDRIGG